MKLLVSLFLILVPFFVTSCDNEKQKETKIDLKEIIKTNNAYANIEWINIEDLDALMAKEAKKVMIFFYRPGCPYCEEMKNTSLTDPNIIKLINDNFYAVMFDGRSKETTVFNGIKYSNKEQKTDVASNHELHQKLVDPYNGNIYWPSTVFLNENYQKLRSYPGLQKTAQFPRVLQNMINR